MATIIQGPYVVFDEKAAICAPDGVLCMFTEWAPEDRATAVLMAAAPDMLAALKRLLASTDPGNVDDHDKGCGCVIHEARAAIARAEGRA